MIEGGLRLGHSLNDPVSGKAPSVPRTRLKVTKMTGSPFLETGRQPGLTDGIFLRVELEVAVGGEHPKKASQLLETHLRLFF
jgi:hypothetical protein